MNKLEYRVITSEYRTHRDGGYEPIDGTYECVGEGYDDWREAHFQSLQHDEGGVISWCQVLHEGKWYEADNDGKPMMNHLADPQEIPFSSFLLEDMEEDPDDYDLEKDENGQYIIPKTSNARELIRE